MSEMQKKVTKAHVITRLPDGTEDLWNPGSWYYTPSEYFRYVISIVDPFQTPQKGYTFYQHFVGYGLDIEARTAYEMLGMDG